MWAKILAVAAPVVRALATEAVHKYAPRVAAWLKKKARALADSAYQKSLQKAGRIYDDALGRIEKFDEGEE